MFPTEFAVIGAPFQVYLMIVAGFILVFRHSWQKVGAEPLSSHPRKWLSSSYTSLLSDHARGRATWVCTGPSMTRTRDRTWTLERHPTFSPFSQCAKFYLCGLSQVWIVSWLVTAAFVFLPAAYLLLPARILIKVDNWFDALGNKINPKVSLAVRVCCC